MKCKKFMGALIAAYTTYYIHGFVNVKRWVGNLRHYENTKSRFAVTKVCAPVGLFRGDIENDPSKYSPIAMATSYNGEQGFKFAVTELGKYTLLLKLDNKWYVRSWTEEQRPVHFLGFRYTTRTVSLLGERVTVTGLPIPPVALDDKRHFVS